jgi:CheY-like chemotaxis protein
MNEGANADLTGKRLLVVEDEYLIANDVIYLLRSHGADIAGPANDVRSALDLVRRENKHLDGAVLDINLAGQRVYPVADALRALRIPFVFTTGYDKSVIDRSFAEVPVCEKPIDKRSLIQILKARLGNDRA